jgi:hypothetical protein
VLEDELDKIRDQDVGVDDLEFCADMVLGAVELAIELDTEG